MNCFPKNVSACFFQRLFTVKANVICDSHFENISYNLSYK